MLYNFFQSIPHLSILFGCLVEMAVRIRAGCPEDAFHAA
ncbi:hypothetical protein AB434_1487 [Heyndrickxia coagulans]|uniref:Uncharacterized protein n=1 Tax=Heyndrickxia coagulans TaxID=1398 RepID=A0AAN0WDZ5_HEYCO|nr:hypothetical protein SB48_HM08orf06137 [Heyndrickxia coagulans]AKN53892.1 hypothetical protein AB434_1487 [Heyndrickxia coagulans]